MATVNALVRICQRLQLSGGVQGIGLRPAVARWARSCGVAGFVHNTGKGVEIVVEGSREALAVFSGGLREKVPSDADIRQGLSQIHPLGGYETFEIIESSPADHLSVPVPPDRGICDVCRGEIEDAGNRRYRYPFTNCAACGPRYSIIEAMPYERAYTAMRHFPMCPQCKTEYCSPNDRRFHAQAICCPECGPQVWLSNHLGETIARGSTALSQAVEALKGGSIVALRGVGGYQLIVDACRQPAVERLRQRKGRRAKPLAVMVCDLEDANRLACLSDGERCTLLSVANPIVVVASRDASRIAPAVTGELNTVGMMLPTTALHALIVADFGGPLICTSGNPEGDPMAADVDESLAALAGIADVWLHHDRPIVAPVDDSVVRVIADRPATIRLGRGLAPLRLDLDCKGQIVAQGGHQKTTVALSAPGQCILSPHIGDLDGEKGRQRYRTDSGRLVDLYRAEPSLVACDLHPDYFTTRLTEASGWPVAKIQHHHAHVVSAMLEQGWLERIVLGVALDGTGYADDGTIWGGEVLLASAVEFTRVGHLLAFPLPGGEVSIRQPWRTSVSTVALALDVPSARQLALPNVTSAEVEQVLQICTSARWSPPTTSAGRLFDAVAALILGRTVADYEGQPAMLLEAACDRSDVKRYPFEVSRSGASLVVDWRPMIVRLLGDRAVGIDKGRMAMRFHRGLAEAIVDVCRHYASLPVVLSGGVFQNRILVELVYELLSTLGREVALPGQVPVNDGGLAAGQLAVAAARTQHPCA